MKICGSPEPSDADLILVKQKNLHIIENSREEAATDVGTFELINCEEVLKGVLGIV